MSAKPLSKKINLLKSVDYTKERLSGTGLASFNAAVVSPFPVSEDGFSNDKNILTLRENSNTPNCNSCNAQLKKGC